MVKLISITKPTIEELSDFTPEELIVYIGRVSNPANQMNRETSTKLIKYLIKNKHWSPFEMVDLTFEIRTSRAVGAQLLRHRSMVFQEFSQRYSDVTSSVPIELRYGGTHNRQSSSEPVKGELSQYFYSKISELSHQYTALYHEMLENNIARECARLILPLSSETTIYMKGSVRSFIHYIQIRTDEHTQIEHRKIAEDIKTIFSANFPNISEALNF